MKGKCLCPSPPKEEPAFPSLEYEARDNTTGEHLGQMAKFSGMSLRDWFAGQALPAVISSVLKPESEADSHIVAEAAYAFADSMLKIRKYPITIDDPPEQATKDSSRREVVKWGHQCRDGWKLEFESGAELIIPREFVLLHGVRTGMVFELEGDSWKVIDEDSQ